MLGQKLQKHNFVLSYSDRTQKASSQDSQPVLLMYVELAYSVGPAQQLGLGKEVVESITHLIHNIC